MINLKAVFHALVFIPLTIATPLIHCTAFGDFPTPASQTTAKSVTMVTVGGFEERVRTKSSALTLR